MSGRLRRALADERGSTMPLIAGSAALALALILVVAAATSLAIERKRLATLADGAALAAAESFDADSLRVDAEGMPTVALDADRVEAAARRHLELAARAGGVEAVLVESSTPDGRSARVVLATRWRPPVAPALLPEGVELEVAATARSVLG
ncbi:hypothetical protein [Homoserinibacter sp. YIM 151385]|uniref:hypothetical protein n=1 Tax=Homoserinibacter sp. YIM 151385 TaxID=2985506 RepID=UPI0022F0C163|nr:hypothetical protein [Homoserinibacter sp. YIM 151385]WBU38203.1 hypothetical protein OF852_01065 [Homoserinibacter sp. YIM 151385]